MTEKDIMVGDWFRFRYTTISNREVVHTFRISQIENQLGQYYVWGDGFGRMCHPENLEPIPLTPEILEKNGWTLWEIEGEYKGVISIYGREAPFGVFDGIEINFVHQLQHALRLCQIQKDITL